MTWYIQSSINIEAHDKTFDICEELNIPFVSVPIIPFSTELPDDIDFSSPGIPYGSTTFIKLASEHPTLKTYNFYDDVLLSPQKYYEELGNKFVNEPLYIGTIRDLPEFDEVFIKCNSDSKAISGSIYTLEDIQELKSVTTTMYQGGDIISPDLVVYCSSLKTLVFETRHIFVNGKWLTGSFYRQEGQRQRERLSEEIHSDIINFARECIEIYNPFPVTVIDVGLDWEGLKCIEYNCFNASGWYECDYRLIIQTVSKMVSDLILPDIPQ